MYKTNMTVSVVHTQHITVCMFLKNNRKKAALLGDSELRV